MPNLDLKSTLTATHQALLLHYGPTACCVTLLGQRSWHASNAVQAVACYSNNTCRHNTAKAYDASQAVNKGLFVKPQPCLTNLSLEIWHVMHMQQVRTMQSTVESGDTVSVVGSLLIKH